MAVRKQVLYWILLALIAVAGMEGFSYLTLWAVPKWRGPQAIYWPVLPDSIRAFHIATVEELLNDKTTYLKYDRVLGWSIKGNGTYGNYSANADYDKEPSADKLRIASFGDSFTHGDEVGNRETWQERMMAADDRLEVINFGVGGYGLGQAYLRYVHHGVQYKPDIVFIGYMPENIGRDVTTFTPFYLPHTGLPLSKPRFAVQDGRLKVHDNPIQSLDGYRRFLSAPDRVLAEIGANDFYLNTSPFSLLPVYYQAGMLDLLASVRLLKMTWFKFKGRTNGRYWPLVRDLNLITMYDPDSEPFQVAVEIFRTFYRRVQEDGAIPVIVIFPDFASNRDPSPDRPHYIRASFVVFQSRGHDLCRRVRRFQRARRNVSRGVVYGRILRTLPASRTRNDCRSVFATLV